MSYPSLFCQTLTLHHPDIQFFFDDSILQNPSIHSVFKPYVIQVEAINKYFGKSSKNTSKWMFLSPVVELTENYLPKGNNLDYRFGQGIYCSGKINDNAGFEVSAVLYEQSFTSIDKYSLDSLKLIPGYNRYIYKHGINAGYFGINGSIYWQPIRWLTLKTGKDKCFIGDGYRSLFLSENAASFPFLQTRLRVWKIDYVFQNLWLNDLMQGFNDKRFQKYAAMHVLSINATKRLNFNVFETVIWRRQDTTHVRTFDIQYLNPFLFFRPVEFNMGSPDNVLLGIGGKYRIAKHNYIYGQLLLDEFRFKELVANKGWWSNKYAYQIGLKIYGLLHNKPSMLLIEYNQARPFTWSHTITTKNYGYLNRPLAHPLGSNFREFVGLFRVYLGKKWMFYTRCVVARYGTDPPGLNFGADIYKPQWTYSKLEGNYTTQGIRNDLLVNDISLSKVLIPSWRLQAGITIRSSVLSVKGIKYYSPSVEFGLHTLLYE